MIFYYWIAIAAALCWAVASLVSADVTRTIGGLAFNRLRLFFVSIMLVSYTYYFNTWSTINIEYLTIIIISGIIGIFLGDTFLFIALQKIGPRRNNILFSLAAPFTVILNIFFLEENMTLLSILGCFTVFFGVVIAIAYGSDNDNDHRWEVVEGSLKIGVFLAILAALCQSIGLIMMKPILDKFNVKRVLNARTNLYTWWHETDNKAGTHIDHDIDQDYLTLIYNIGESDGGTYIEGHGKIDKVKNRLIVFDGKTPHRAIYQTNSKAQISTNINIIV